MQNPNARAHGTAHLGLRASRMLLLLGVFVAVPAAAPARHIAESSETSTVQIQTKYDPTLLAEKASPTWDEDFESLMRRIYKWWACAVPNPGETVEDQMERMRLCYQRNGVPNPMDEQDRKELDQDIDDIIRHTENAPNTINQGSLAAFRELMFEILLKVG